MSTMQQEVAAANAEEIDRWKEAVAQLPALYSSEETPMADKIMGAKWFGPGRYTYFATEFDPESRTLFGYCVSPLGPDCDEWGYQLIDEFASVLNPFGMIGIELDQHFAPTKFSDLNLG